MCAIRLVGIAVLTLAWAVVGFARAQSADDYDISRRGQEAKKLHQKEAEQKETAVAASAPVEVHGVAYFCSHPDVKNSEMVTVDKISKAIQVEWITNGLGVRCIFTLVNGRYGPLYSGDTANYCSLDLAHQDNGAVHQSVTISGSTVTASADDPQRSTISIDLETGILRTGGGRTLECHRPHA